MVEIALFSFLANRQLRNDRGLIRKRIAVVRNFQIEIGLVELQAMNGSDEALPGSVGGGVEPDDFLISPRNRPWLSPKPCRKVACIRVHGESVSAERPAFGPAPKQPEFIGGDTASAVPSQP